MEKTLQDCWLANLDKLNTDDCLSDCSCIAYRTRSLLYLRWLKENPDVDNCREFIDEMIKSNKKPQTINITKNALVRLFRANGIEIKLKKEKIIRTLALDNVIDENDWSKLLEYLKEHNEKYYLIVLMIGTTGLRVHEALKVTFDDIENGKMVIKGKGGKRRYVFFTEMLRDACRGNKGYVCTSRWGDVISTRGIASQLKYYAKCVGIAPEKMHPHSFRHFFAKQYLRYNPNGLTDLAKLLGHSSVNTTMIYLQKSEDEMLNDYKKAVLW